MTDWLPDDWNPIFAAYATFTALLLGGAGLVLCALHFALKKDVAGIARTYRGWLLMAPLVFLALYFGRVTAICGIALLAVGGFKEFARATGLYRDWLYTGAVYSGIAGMTAVMLARDPDSGEAGWYGMYMALPVYVIALLLTIPVLRNRAQGQLQLASLSIVGFVYLGWMFGHLGFLANSTHAYGYLLYLIFAVELNDVAAFTFGKLFGKRPLRSAISPNKTVGGSLGAIGFSMCLPWLLHFSFPHFETTELLLTGLIVGVGGQLGDLTISFIKRDLGIKDMGNLIPGHGGILDRVDSLIFVAPLFFHMVRRFHGL